MQHGVKSEYTSGESWGILSSVEQSIKAKIEAIGTPLREWNVNIYRGVITGFNEAFIISKETKDKLIAEDPNSAEIIRPILRGRDIKRYSYQFADLWVILAGFGSHMYLQEKYPAVYSHLCSYEEQLKKRGQCRYTSSGKANASRPYPGQHHWLELDNNPSIEYLDDFSKQKIVWGNLCLSAQYTLAEENLYISAPSPIITNAGKYVLALLNSKLLDWYVRQLGVTRNGGYFEYKPMFVEKIPVPHIASEKEKAFEDIVDIILDCKKKGEPSEEYEREIDKMVFELFNLTKEEINHVLSH